MNAKKIVTAGLALVMVAGISVAGTLAFLTDDTDLVKNTFTVGNVNITLDEANVDKKDAEGVDNSSVARDTANTYKLIPGSTYDKDPIVHVTKDSEPCWVIVDVNNGLGDAEAAVTEDSLGTIADQITANGWTKKGDYYYMEVNQEDLDEVEDGKTLDLTVFTKFAIKGDLEDATYEDLVDAEITIKAFAIQSEGVSIDQAYTQIPEDYFA